MRLAAISFFSDGPVHGGFVELGDVTALVGANDVGKTRFLRLLETALSDPDRCEMADLFGIASEEEVEALIDREAVDRLLQDSVDAVPEFAADLEAPVLPDGVRVGVRLPAESGYTSAFRYGRYPAELDAELGQSVQDALPASGPEPAFEPVKLECLGQTDTRLLPEPVVVPSAIVAVRGELGQAAIELCYTLRELARRWEVPEPGAAEVSPWSPVPRDLEELVAGGRREVVDVTHVGPGLEPAEAGLDVPDPDWLSLDPPARFDATGRLGWGWLVEEDEDASRIQPAAIVACHALQAIAARHLPSFITTDYRPEIAPAQPTEIALGEPVRLQLMRLDTAPDWLDDEDGLRFDLEHAASGYHLWIELALRETVARTRTLTHILYQGTRCLRLAAVDALDVPLDEVRAVLRETLRHLRDPRTPAPQDTEAVMDGGRTDPPPYADEPDPGLFALPRSRVYLIDEPEQRLHPALQRRAARWLSTLMNEWAPSASWPPTRWRSSPPPSARAHTNSPAPTRPTTPRSRRWTRPR